MKELLGKWKVDINKDENLEEFFKAIGLNFAFRKLGKMVAPTEEIKKVNGDTWSLLVVVPARICELVFRYEEEIPETTFDGRKCVTTFRVDEDGGLIQYQRSVNPSIPDTIVTRRPVNESSIVQVYEAVGKNVKSTRTLVRMD